MPNRIIKDTICESKGLSEVSFFAEDLYKRLITYADDYGRFNADFQIILARLYPREINLVTVDDIEDAMTELVGVRKIAFYVSKGRSDLYGCFPNWNAHQRVRDSKKKIPEPEDGNINDWYLRRFVPISMKVDIIERDKFTCQDCGKPICPGVESAKRLVKMGAGLFHIDHLVPVNQGGRATMENLRLLCPDCNRRRQRHFTFEEILAFTLESSADGGNLQKVAADCGEMRPNPIQSNPIRIQSNTTVGQPDEQPTEGEREPDDPELGRVMTFFLDRINATPSPVALESLTAYTQDLGADVVLHALGIALDEHKTGWRYIQGILQRYAKDGLRSMDAVHRAEQDFEAKKGTTKQTAKGPLVQTEAGAEELAMIRRMAGK